MLEGSFAAKDESHKKPGVEKVFAKMSLEASGVDYGGKEDTKQAAFNVGRTDFPWLQFSNAFPWLQDPKVL